MAEVLAAGSERNILTVLDVTKPYGKDWSFIYEALKYIDIMHINTGELEGITGIKDLKKGLVKLQEMGVKVPIVTDGSSGALVLISKRFLSQPAFKVKAVDPTGAGDAFCAGLIKAVSERRLTKEDLEHLPPEEMSEMLLFAQASGAACVEAIGTTVGVSLYRVKALIEEQGKQILSSTIISL